LAAGKWLIVLGLLGMLAGVLAFDLVFPSLADWGIRSFPQSITAPLVLDISYGHLATAFGVLVLLMVAVADRLDPGKRLDPEPDQKEPLWRREWGFGLAGASAGLIILASSAQGQYFGLSGSYAALTAHIADWFGFSLESVPTLNETTAWRAASAAGLFPGAAASALMSKSFGNVPVTPLWAAAHPSGVKSRGPIVFVGGFMVLFGALIGGGCTTGAFMAAWPTLSVGSFAMGATFFGTGMATATLLYWGKWGLLSEVRSRGLSLATD
jgi:hypothetical protein|tara:strand:+ start:3231 stop:4034 length:804 start_codon:yes stop_codon:yes gene_type:complete